MKVDFKITTWERIQFDDSHNEAVKQALINGEINSGDDLIAFLESRKGDFSQETLFDCSEQMTTQENDNQSTIELLEGAEVIWNNLEGEL